MMIFGDEQVEWIALETGHDIDIVRTVLALELEYMAMVGIATPPLDYQFQYYERDPDWLPDPISYLDTFMVARDCQRLAGIAESVAHDIFLAELTLLEEMGLA